MASSSCHAPCGLLLHLHQKLQWLFHGGGNQKHTNLLLCHVCRSWCHAGLANSDMQRSYLKFGASAFNWIKMCFGFCSGMKMEGLSVNRSADFSSEKNPFAQQYRCHIHGWPRRTRHGAPAVLQDVHVWRQLPCSSSVHGTWSDVRCASHPACFTGWYLSHRFG